MEGLHRRNIVHRDVKVENVLLSDLTCEAKARLADFGSALKLRSALDVTSFRVGTPGYIAPEIIKGQAYSFSCDVWSLGCLLYVLLTAVPPFWDSERKSREHKVCHERLDFSASPNTRRLSSSCQDLLTQLLEKDPTRRPSISSVLQHEWFQNS